MTKFFLWARNLDEYFTKFIPSKFLNFSSFAGQKFKTKEKFVKI